MQQMISFAADKIKWTVMRIRGKRRFLMNEYIFFEIFMKCDSKSFLCNSPRALSIWYEMEDEWAISSKSMQ